MHPQPEMIYVDLLIITGKLNFNMKRKTIKQID